MVLGIRKELVLRKDGDILRLKKDVRVSRNGGGIICYDEEVV